MTKNHDHNKFLELMSIGECTYFSVLYELSLNLVKILMGSF